MESHIRDFSIQQLANLEKTIQLQHIQVKHDWKEQYSNAQKWCTEFRVPTQIGKR